MSAQGPPQHRGVCPETQRSVTNIQFKTRLIPTPTQSAVTVGVVGINVGIGGVPALDGPVNSAAETLLSGAAHDHTQYGPPVQKHQLRPRVSSYTDLRTGSLFFFCLFTCEPWTCRLVPRPKRRSCGQKHARFCEHNRPGGPFRRKDKDTHFLAGAVFCRFHIFSVWSSEAVTRTGSTGWNVRARMPSKWLRRVNLGFHVFLIASLLLPIWRE